MVGIKYTGIDGKTTSFNSSSADGAIERLRGISGYLRNGVEDAVASVSSNIRDARKARAKAFSERPVLTGQIGGAKYTSRGGTVSGLENVSGLRVDNGNIIMTTQKQYVNESGNLVSVGPKKERSIGTITQNENADKEDSADSSTIEVVIETKYDPDTHVLYNIVGEYVLSNGTLALKSKKIQNITVAVQETVGK